MISGFGILHKFVIFYLSVTPGSMKNIQKCIPKTKTTWNTHFPSKVFLRYRARSTTIVANWMRSMTRKASGTWSSDNDSVMSAAAVCFYLNKQKNEFIVYQITQNVNLNQNCCVENRQSHPKSPIAEDNNDEVYNIDQEH